MKTKLLLAIFVIFMISNAYASLIIDGGGFEGTDFTNKWIAGTCHIPPVSCGTTTADPWLTDTVWQTEGTQSAMCAFGTTGSCAAQSTNRFHYIAIGKRAGGASGSGDDNADRSAGYLIPSSPSQSTGTQTITITKNWITDWNIITFFDSSSLDNNYFTAKYFGTTSLHIGAKVSIDYNSCFIGGTQCGSSTSKSIQLDNIKIIDHNVTTTKPSEPVPHHTDFNISTILTDVNGDAITLGADLNLLINDRNFPMTFSAGAYRAMVSGGLNPGTYDFNVNSKWETIDKNTSGTLVIYSDSSTIRTIEGFSDTNNVRIFGYSRDGNITIGFDTNSILSYLLDLNFSTNNIQASGTNLFDDANITQTRFTCTPDKNFPMTNRPCTVDWNITSVSDGNYFLKVFLSRDGNTSYNASDSNFGIDNTKPVFAQIGITTGNSNPLPDFNVQFTETNPAQCYYDIYRNGSLLLSNVTNDMNSQGWCNINSFLLLNPGETVYLVVNGADAADNNSNDYTTALYRLGGGDVGGGGSPPSNPPGVVPPGATENPEETTPPTDQEDDPGDIVEDIWNDIVDIINDATGLDESGEPTSSDGSFDLINPTTKEKIEEGAELIIDSKQGISTQFTLIIQNNNTNQINEIVFDFTNINSNVKQYDINNLIKSGTRKEFRFLLDGQPYKNETEIISALNITANGVTKRYVLHVNNDELSPLLTQLISFLSKSFLGFTWLFLLLLLIILLIIYLNRTKSPLWLQGVLGIIAVLLFFAVPFIPLVVP